LYNGNDMKLSDLFEQLTYGELSSVFMGGVDNIGIEPDKYNQIIPHVNLGLIELYKRFPLRTEEVIIKLYDQIQVYYLEWKYAQTNTESTEPIKYIDDSIYQPFNSNVLKIDSVHDEDGQELFLNDTNEYWSVHTPSYNSILIPYPDSENSLSVLYRAGPKKIEITNLDPTTQDVDIPPGLLEPLLFYIAGRVFSNLNSDGKVEGNTYTQKFEQAIKQIELSGLYKRDNTSNLKLPKQGWV